MLTLTGCRFATAPSRFASLIRADCELAAGAPAAVAWPKSQASLRNCKRFGPTRTPARKSDEGAFVDLIAPDSTSTSLPPESAAGAVGPEAIREEREHGEPEAPFSLQMLPWRHTKTVHFIRHGEGYHNIAREMGKDWTSNEFIDAHLTPVGWQQAAALKRHIAGSRGRIRPEVVIVSPLTRAIETAIGVFGGPEWHPNDAAEPLMHSQEAEEACRENMGVNPCNRRRATELYAARYPAIDFSLVAPGEDTQWQADVRELGPEVKARGLAFARWLMQRPEQELAVVSHCTFLFFLMSNFSQFASAPTSLQHSANSRHLLLSGTGWLPKAAGDLLGTRVKECNDLGQKGEMERWFENCELRTLVLSDARGEGNLDPLWFPGGRGSLQQEPAAK